MVDELELMRRRAEDLHQRTLQDLSRTRLDAVARRGGLDAVLNERCNGWFVAARGFFRAAAFSAAARCFREWHAAANEYADWHASQGDTVGAATWRQERARHSWSVDLELFRRYVREGCEPHGSVAPSLDVLAALFMSWAVLGERYHEAHWLAAWDSAADSERLAVARQHRGNDEARLVATAVLVEARVARGLYWLGRREAAGSAARVAAMGFADWPRVRPPGLLLRSKRAWRRRCEGLAALTAAGDARAQAAAASLFAKALLAAADTRSDDWKDLVLLHVTALARTQADHPTVTDFLAAFPQLGPVVTS